MELAQGLVVANKFRLVRELGRGGMGSVWLAQHRELDIPCAVKFIEGEALNVPQMRERFTREAKAAAQLRSPHVVQILDQGVWDDLPYIAMELLDGEDVGKRLQKVGRIAPGDCVAILAQVARALSKAHQLGIVHRDLKPDNIYLVRDDDRELVKILDFGIAKVNQHGLGGGSNTRTGTLLGTPYYMSPEQAQGNKTVDFRSDLWSLAIIAFECLTGRRPFESDALGDLLLRIIVHPIPPILAASPDLPPRVEEWWARASCREPAGRFQSAREFVEALAAALGVPVAGEVVARPSLVGDSVRPASPYAASVAAGQAPGARTTGARTVQPMVSTGELDLPAKRSPVALIVGLAAAVVLALGTIAFVVVLPRRGGVPGSTQAAPAATAPPPQEAAATASATTSPPTASAVPAKLEKPAKKDTKAAATPSAPPVKAPAEAPPVKTPAEAPPPKAKDETGF